MRCLQGNRVSSLSSMNTQNEPPKYPDAPNQEQISDQNKSTWPPQKRDGYENPSLERYTDLRFGDQQRGHRKWVIAVAAVLALVAIIVLGFMAAIYAEARGDETRPVDAIIVLGTTQWNGQPQPAFEARLRHTLELYQEGIAPVIIVTGGKQPADNFTEAETAETWLMDRGVPENAILMENEGRNTWGNMTGAWDAAAGHDIHTVLIVSDGFHLFRAERMANAVGFEAYTSPTPYSPIRPWSAEEFSYVIRETVAVIVQMPRWLF